MIKDWSEGILDLNVNIDSCSRSLAFSNFPIPMSKNSLVF